MWKLSWVDFAETATARDATRFHDDHHFKRDAKRVRGHGYTGLVKGVARR